MLWEETLGFEPVQHWVQNTRRACVGDVRASDIRDHNHRSFVCRCFLRAGGGDHLGGVAATGLAWLARRPAALARESGNEGRATRLLQWTVVAYLAWWLITTATSVAPGQSVLGSFGRGMGLLVVGSAALLFFLVRSECRTPDAIRGKERRRFLWTSSSSTSSTH